MKTKITLMLLIAFSLVTSFMAVFKVIAAGKSISAVAGEIFQKDNIAVEEIERIDQEEDPKTDDSPAEITSQPTAPLKPTKTITRTPTSKPVVVKVDTPTPTSSSSPNNNLCLVTLFGRQYNVTQLRSTHSGGDVFKCGTDQSALYQSKHGTSMSRMAAYLYDPNNPTSNQNNTVPTGSTTNYDDDDREDSEHEDKYYEKQEKPEDHEDELSEEDD